MRIASKQRDTKETKIKAEINIDGKGIANITTGIGFFDHMLTLLTKHALIDMTINAVGDIQVDEHHTVEDVGIVIGTVLKEALGDKVGITRYGTEFVPMDEALAMCSLDISGREFLAYDVPISGVTGSFDAQLAEEFFRAVANAAGITLHIKLFYGANTHHCLEAIFKAFARAFRKAASLDARETGIPSTKGVL